MLTRVPTPHPEDDRGTSTSNLRRRCQTDRRRHGTLEDGVERSRSRGRTGVEGRRGTSYVGTGTEERRRPYYRCRPLDLVGDGNESLLIFIDKTLSSYLKFYYLFLRS